MVVLTVRPALATNCSYSLEISENLGALDPFAPNVTSATAGEWVYLRNHPYLLVKNTSDVSSGASLESLTIQLKNLTQNLSMVNTPASGVYAVAGTDGNTPTIGLPATTVPVSGNSGSEITIDFPQPLDPNAEIVFRLELDPATSQDKLYADYRQIFFTFGDNTDNNATSMASFDASEQTINTIPEPWDNLPAVDADSTTFSTAFSCLNSPDTVFTIPSVVGSNIPVPEPSTFILASLGLAGVFVSRLRLRAR
jgi:hypothetical protein